MFAGTVVGALLQYGLGFFFGYILLFVGPFAGRFVGDLILRVVGQKRGLALEILAGASIVVGSAIVLFTSGEWLDLVSEPIRGTVYVVAVGLTAWAAIARVRNQ